MTISIIVEFDPPPLLKTSGDGCFEPVVIGGAGVVNVCIIECLHYLTKELHAFEQIS